MPRWPNGYRPKQRQTCPSCGGSKDFYAKACRSCSEVVRPLLGRKGEQHPAWKGGMCVDRDGYLKRYAPDHPWPRRRGYVREHVRIMELHLGRRITASESVHHIDHDRTNNSLENLELMERGAHSRHHRELDTHLRVRDGLGRFAGSEVSNARA